MSLGVRWQEGGRPVNGVLRIAYTGQCQHGIGWDVARLFDCVIIQRTRETNLRCLPGSPATEDGSQHSTDDALHRRTFRKSNQLRLSQDRTTRDFVVLIRADLKPIRVMESAE